MHSIEILLNNFKRLDLKTKSPEMQHHLEEATSVTTEDLVMDHEEEEDRADHGMGIGHAVTLFNLEVEAEALQPPINNNLSPTSQHISSRCRIKSSVILDIIFKCT
ncbi:hypothetical protein K501DRAFT_169962 [Backusella circina FSU 941]|nr:hypothetical protein K501DRAFT_169962 [Backusella circina FSU 941]